jgi:hypothetical protein
VPKSIPCGNPYTDLRASCGIEAVKGREELQALRVEVWRFSQLLDRAITALEAAGESKIAKSLQRDLEVPIETIRTAANTRPRYSMHEPRGDFP